MSRTNDRRFLFDARVAARGSRAADKSRKRGENAVKMESALGPDPTDLAPQIFGDENRQHIGVVLWYN